MSTALDTGGMLANSYGVEQFIPVGALQIDHSYQRPLNAARASKIAKAFDFELAGRLIVSRREGEGYWVVDGQHRLAAMRVRRVALAPCVVYTGWTAEHEARIFYEANTTVKKPSLYERHRAALLIGEPVAVGIDAIVREIGGEISEKHPDGGTRQRIAALEIMGRVYRTRLGAKTGPERLRETLHLIMDCWGDKQYSHKGNRRPVAPFNSAIIHGVALFIAYAENDPNYSLDILRAVLSRVTPAAVAQDASAYFTTGHVQGAAIANAIVDLYNHGRRTKRVRQDGAAIRDVVASSLTG